MSSIFARLHTVHLRKLDRCRAQLRSARLTRAQRYTVSEEARATRQAANDEVLDGQLQLQLTLRDAAFVPAKIPDFYRHIDVLRQRANEAEQAFDHALALLQEAEAAEAQLLEATKKQQARATKIDALARAAITAALANRERLAELEAEENFRRAHR